MGGAGVKFFAYHIAGVTALLYGLGQKTADFHRLFDIFQGDLRGGVHFGLEDDVSGAEDLSGQRLAEGQVYDAVQERFLQGGVQEPLFYHETFILYVIGGEAQWEPEMVFFIFP